MFIGFMPAIIANLILAACATIIGLSGFGKWPRLLIWLGGLGAGNALMMIVSSTVLT